MKILIVDDEYDILEFLSYNLKKEGYEVFTAQNGIDGLKQAKKIIPDLIILDVMMPEMDGMQLCEQIKSTAKLENAFIIFLTARSEEYSELAGFSSGADDYVTKPISPKLLISRIKAILKRGNGFKDDDVISIEKLLIDKQKHIVKYDDQDIVLARKEFKLLYCLMTMPGKVFTREELITKVWNDAYVGDRTIDVHIRKIREKIGVNYIKTVKGVGYKFNL
tara:strand:- start:205004 stop:205666 length:663 start_codon:yes stop_codon:yes gene_type:complete